MIRQIGAGLCNSSNTPFSESYAARLAPVGRPVASGVMQPDPTVFVLFGATGDLSKRMVLPAFFTLAKEGLLPERWRLVGNGRGDVAHEDFRKHVHDVLNRRADSGGGRGSS